MYYQNLRLVLSCLLLAGVSANPTMAHAAESTASLEQPMLEEVVVTARRREENVQKSPVAVTALSERHLDQTGARSLVDYAASVPGLSFVGNNSPENKIVLRGVSTGVVTRDEGSVVGLYIDDVPVGSRRFNPDLRLYDIERIEVLRGPQGTLFGEGSIGGTLRLVPNKPSLEEFEATLQVGGSQTHKGGGNYEVAAVLNAPVVADRLGIRLVSYQVEESGYVDNVTLDQKNVNEARTNGQRLIAKLAPGDRTTITATVLRQETDVPGKAQFDPELGDLLQARNYEEALADEFTLANLTVSRVFDSFIFDSSTAYFDRSVVNLRDISPLLGGLPIYLDDLTEFESVVQEFRLTSSRGLFRGHLDWLVGFYYRDDEEYFRQDAHAPALGGDVFDSDNYLDRQQIALFGEIDLRLAEGLTLSTGLRWFDIDQEGENFNGGLLAGLPPGVIDVTETNASENGVSPKFRIAYEQEDWLFYATASRGFREGGPTGEGVPPDPITGEAAPTQFDSDALWNYELGVKTSWADSRVVLNGAVFYIDWEDIQTTSIRSDGHTFTLNAGAARSKGVEAELRMRPVDGLEFFLTTSYVDSELTEDQLPPGDGVAGDRIPGVPDWSLSMGAHYIRPVSPNVDGFLNVTYRHVGDSYNGFGTSTGISGSGADKQAAYDLVNLRLGLQSDSWEAVLYAENIGDERAVLFYNRIVGDVRINTVRPRTLGLSLKFRF